MKKVMSLFLAAFLLFSMTAGCTPKEASNPSANPDESGALPSAAANNFIMERAINVVTRESGSGTRGAFIELFGIEVKSDGGKKTDTTTEEAITMTTTAAVLTNIAGDPYAIGYVSLGSLNDTVKALEIDGVQAAADNIKNGSYTVSRPFNIATKGEAEGLARDFIDFILSAEGQAVVGSKYIAVEDAAAPYAGNKPAGKIVIAGSSSVSPIMEELKEAYRALNPNATVEIQANDSTTGLNDAIDGACDIAMASRDLTDSEKAALKSVEIARDGIAVIVHSRNPLTNLTKDQVKGIYTGETEKWSDIA